MTKHKYVYVVTESTSNSEANADIKVYSNADSANKDYNERYEFYTHRYYCNHIYNRRNVDNGQYDISTTIVLYNDNKITLKLVKALIGK